MGNDEICTLHPGGQPRELRTGGQHPGISRSPHLWHTHCGTLHVLTTAAFNRDTLPQRSLL